MPNNQHKNLKLKPVLKKRIPNLKNKIKKKLIKNML